jgi:hypothetical protein
VTVGPPALHDVDEIPRPRQERVIPLGRALDTASLRVALDRLAYYLGDALPIAEDSGE